jgi:hypothetical protein
MAAQPSPPIAAGIYNLATTVDALRTHADAQDGDPPWVDMLPVRDVPGVANAGSVGILAADHDIVQMGYGTPYEWGDPPPTTANKGWPDQGLQHTPGGWKGFPSSKVGWGEKNPNTGRPWTPQRRALFETSPPNLQCEHDGQGPITAGVLCYICGLPIFKHDGGGGSSEKEGLLTGKACEHVLPAFIMSLICGLWGTAPEVVRREVLNSLVTAAVRLPGAGALFVHNHYTNWASGVRANSYLWSHAECNYIKNQFPFLNLTLKNSAAGPEISSLAYSVDNVTHLLMRLLREDGGRGKTWRKHYNSLLSILINVPEMTSNIQSLDVVNKLKGWVVWAAAQLQTTHIQPLIDSINMDLEYRDFYMCISVIVTGKLIIKISPVLQAISELGPDFNDFHDSARKMVSDGRRVSLGGARTPGKVKSLKKKGAPRPRPSQKKVQKWFHASVPRRYYKHHEAWNLVRRISKIKNTSEIRDWMNIIQNADNPGADGELIYGSVRKTAGIVIKQLINIFRKETLKDHLDYMFFGARGVLAYLSKDDMPWGGDDEQMPVEVEGGKRKTKQNKRKTKKKSKKKRLTKRRIRKSRKKKRKTEYENKNKK